MEFRLEIAEEPVGDTYQQLLQFAVTRCGQFSLIWRDQMRFAPAAQTIAITLAPYLIRESSSNSWPGTRLLNGSALVRHYKMTYTTLQALASITGLYAWTAPGCPEDLAFYTDEGNVWLASVSHERMAWFADVSLSREEINRYVPGLLLRA